MRRSSNVQALPAAPALPAVDLQPGLLGLCAVLFKLRIGLAIMLSALGGAVVAGSRWPGLVDTTVLALSVLIAASGAGAFNHWFDRDIDALMGRTKNRPFVNGRLDPASPWPVLFSIMILAGSGLAAWRFGPACGAFVAAGALTYALVYTVWLKRRTDFNIVIGGAAGSWAVLAGAAAASEILSPEVLLLSAVLFLWTPSHFWSLAIALSDDYRRAGVPMLPVTRGRRVALRWNLINTAFLATSAIWLAALINTPFLWAGALMGSVWLVWTTLAMARRDDRASAMRAFKASLIQLGLLLAGVFAAYAMP